MRQRRQNRVSSKKATAALMEAIERRLLMATVNVLNSNDTGVGSLRDAIALASPGDTINLAPGIGDITLTSGEIDPTMDLTITGSGQRISGNGTGGIFGIHNVSFGLSNVQLTDANGIGVYCNGVGVSLTLDHVAFTSNNGTAVFAGGGNGSNPAQGVTFDATDCSFTDNTSTGGSSAIGISGALATLTRCTFENNVAHAPVQSMGMPGMPAMPGQAQGGAVGVWSGPTVMSDCTFANNSVTADPANGQNGTAQGGAIFATNSYTSVSLLNCTIVGNSALSASGQGGGIFASSAALTLTNTLVAQNTAVASDPDVFADNLSDGGHNLIGAVSSGGITNGTNGDLAGTTGSPLDPKIDALADNGGATKTMALQAGSPAIDAGDDNAAPSTDQRGNARDGTSDIGAFEYTPPLVSNHAPAFSSTPVNDEAGAGTYWQYDVATTDADSGDHLAITAVDKPAWLNLTDFGDGTAALGGTPDYSDYGAASVTLRVSDGTTTTDQTFTVNISAAKAELDDKGVLHVNGTDDADFLHVWMRDSRSQVRVSINGAIRNFDAGDVKEIDVLGFGGDDTILINASLIPAHAMGMDGNDTLTGGSGNDTLEGNDGNDWLLGQDGNDSLIGGNGDDALLGGIGHDTLEGDDGNDTFYDRDGYTDSLNGGNGTDSAQADSIGDTADQIENILP